MTISATEVRFDGATMWVELEDGRTLGRPAYLVSAAARAPHASRTAVEISLFGLHWENLDEDISVAGLLAGRGHRTAASRSEVA